MSTQDFGDYTITTTVTPNGKTEQVQFKAGTEGANKEAVLAKARAALTANQTFLAIASPSAAQVAAQTKALTRECSALIRLLLGQLNDVSDT